MHDTDGNNKLDGCELVKSLIHWHGREKFIFYLCFGTQCCWSGMFIPDPGSELLNPGSRVKKIPDPGSRFRIHIKEVFLTQKIVSELSEIWSGMFIPDQDLDFLPILDPGSTGLNDTGSGSATMLEPHRCHRGPHILRKLKIHTFAWMHFLLLIHASEAYRMGDR